MSLKSAASSAPWIVTAGVFSTAFTSPRRKLIACASAIRLRALPPVLRPRRLPPKRFYGRAAEIARRQGVVRSNLSLTHTADLAVASVVLEDGQ